jgi:hypothetical protein
MRLWLDDVREPWKHGYILSEWVRTYEEAVNMLETGMITFASLDHDLSVEAACGQPCSEKTGYDVVCWMELHNVWPKDGVVVHSMNPVGRARMQQVIDKHYQRKGMQ